MEDKKEKLFQIVYSSIARNPMSQQDLEEILAVSRPSNQARNISGMLLYHNQRFMQVLEGAQRDVQEVFHKKIAKDSRHGHIWILLEMEIEARSFDDWSMGFLALDKRDIIDASTGKTFPQFNDPAYRSNQVLSFELLNQFYKQAANA